jgi:hypothetical protein
VCYQALGDTRQATTFIVRARDLFTREGRDFKVQEADRFLQRRILNPPTPETTPAETEAAPTEPEDSESTPTEVQA